MEFKQYSRKGLSEMTPIKTYIGDLGKVSVSGADKLLDNEIFNEGFIARNPKNHNDLWYVSKKYFDENLEEVPLTSKSLGNTTASQAKDNVKDIVFWGDGDAWKLLGKASSKNEGWMKSSKAMQINGVGCVIQVTTQQGDNVAEAVTFIPGVKIEAIQGAKGKVISRKLIQI